MLATGQDQRPLVFCIITDRQTVPDCKIFMKMTLINTKVYKIYRFYREGFSNMPSWGRRVWLVILIKLFLMFAVLKLFFFPDILNKNFDNDKERGEHVLDELIIKTDTDD